jgi:hypothetical protein
MVGANFISDLAALSDEGSMSKEELTAIVLSQRVRTSKSKI